MKSRVLARDPEAGLTLIELLAAISILALGAVAGLTVLVQAHKSNTMARAKTMAINAAQQQMETVFNAAPGDVNVWFNNQTFPVDNRDPANPNVGNLVSPVVQPDGTRNAGIITVDQTTNPPTVTVTVAWQGRGTLAPGQVTLTALRSPADR